MHRIGHIGIGIMGSGMVKNLLKHGVAVAFAVHQRRDRVSELVACGAREVPDYCSLVEESDVITMSVPDSSVVEPLLLSEDGIGPHLRAGQIVIDLSTSYPPSTRKIASVLEPRGVTLLDAPVTGSQPQAEAGTLNVMCGGPRETFDAVRPIFDAIAANVFHVGPVGSGHAVKLINNFLGQVSVAAVCEMLPLAQKYGLDLNAFVEAISVSGGNSPWFQILMPRVLERDFAPQFQQKYVHKDVRYINDLARSQSVPMPLASALFAIHDMAGAKGYAEQDISALLKFWEQMSGVTVGEDTR